MAIGLKAPICALPSNHVRQRLMSRAPWNKLLAGGSLLSEWWLPNSGPVAQSAPEYSGDKHDKISDKKHQ